MSFLPNLDQSCFQTSEDLVLCLDIHKRDGTRIAFPYSLLRQIKLDPTGTIECVFGGEKITIIGTSLVKIYDSLVSQSLQWVKEIGEKYRTDSEETPQIYKIEIEENM
jgi:hypothetical protein